MLSQSKSLDSTEAPAQYQLQIGKINTNPGTEYRVESSYKGGQSPLDQRESSINITNHTTTPDLPRNISLDTSPFSKCKSQKHRIEGIEKGEEGQKVLTNKETVLAPSMTVSLRESRKKTSGQEATCASSLKESETEGIYQRGLVSQSKQRNALRSSINADTSPTFGSKNAYGP